MFRPVVGEYRETYTTTATAAGTTALTVASNYQQVFTGSTTQTVTMPVTSTLVLGREFMITNLSSGAVTVQSSGANNIQVMSANTYLLLKCILTSGTGTASWTQTYGTIGGLTASRAVATDANGTPTVSSTTSTELGYVNGVTSAIQTQLNAVSLLSVVAKTTTYTATVTDRIITCSTASGWTLTLPAASGNSGLKYYIKKTSSDLNALTIDGNASETIDGSLTTTINTQYEAVEIVCDGSNWHILDRVIPGEWATFSPTCSWTANTSVSCKARRIGDSLEIHASIDLTGAPTATDLTLTLPAGYTIDTAKLPSTTASNLSHGSVSIKDSGVRNYVGGCVYNSSTAIATTHSESGNNGFINATNPVTFGNADSVGIHVMLPISGWKS